MDDDDGEEFTASSHEGSKHWWGVRDYLWVSIFWRDSWMTNGSVLSVGPQDILVGDRDYVSGKWSDLAALTFLPWAAPGSSATSSRTYGWLGLLPHTLYVHCIPKAENRWLRGVGHKALQNSAQGLLHDREGAP